jgi:glycosyltransferase involved in cell wall biosynthesis
LGLKTINFEVDSYPTDFERSKFKWTLKRLLRGWLKVGVHDCYIANAHHQRRFLLDFAALPPDRIVTVVNGIDAGKFCPGQPPDPASLGLPRTDYYIVSISQARPEKRVDVAIEAAAEIFRTRPELSLTFIHIGDGQCLEPWKAKAAELGLGDRFQFPGSRSDVLPYLRLATAFVHPAERESFGFAVVEAMACAKPVVAARSAGPAEIIVPEATGFLVDSGDAKSLARELLKLVDDPSLREGMGRAARERVLEHYDSRKQALELARAIRERLK